MTKSALIIEDEDLMRDLLRQILLNSCFKKIVTCSSYSSAKTKIKTQICDVAFVDIELGDGNGLHLIKDIKEHSPITKIIMVSGHSSPENVKLAIAKGADAFVTKPFSVEKLMLSLTRIGIPCKIAS